jgi:hypothetical protein
MRGLLGIILALSMATARADRILLVPLDTRPAAGQFAQMIARIAGEDLRMPPYELLGRFTTPGSPDEILTWLRAQDLSKVDTLIVSSDMLCYGGLIASRANNVSAAVAESRLNALAEIRRNFPRLRLYVFSATMRLTPTATRQAAPWRLRLARYEELLDRFRRLKITSLQPEVDALRLSIPPTSLAAYEKARSRDLEVQRHLVQLAHAGDLDYLVISEDDAQPYGPQIADTIDLENQVTHLGVAGRVYFCEGIDQDASVLVSRALLQFSNWFPRVRVVYSDPLGRRKYASYETKPIELSLQDQLLASGARYVKPGEDYDYTLFVNTPKRREEPFADWLKDIQTEVDLGLPVAVADVNLAYDGTADQELFDGLSASSRMTKLLAFAGWNTAGNSLGTAIPEANVYLLAKKLNVDPLNRELAQREFLLCRYADDYAYHKFTRPVAYTMILSANHDEVYGEDFFELDDFVDRDMEKNIQRTFDREFMGQRFTAGDKTYEICGLENVRVWLPWPRAYEVRLQFKLEARPVPASTPPFGL